MQKINKLFLFIAIIIFLSIEIKAQEIDTVPKKSSFDITGGTISSFIWRGIVISPTLCFQSMISYSYKNFSIGAWGGVDLFGDFKEIDIIAGYSAKGFSVFISDYYGNPNKKYFNFKQNTGHNIEAELSYENKKFPLKILIATFLVGEDKKINYDLTQTNTKLQNFSTYFELSYTFRIKQNNLNVFIGATPFTGLYGNDFNVIYTGLTASKEIKITNKFSLSIFTTFSVNPQTENYFAVFGINL